MFTFEQPGGREVPVARILLRKLQLFERRPELAAKGRYTITSNVNREVVDMFFARVMGDDTVVVTEENAEKLQFLCEELGFAGFDDEIRHFLGGDWKVRKDLVDLSGRVDRHDAIIEELQRRVLELEQQLRDQRGVPERVEPLDRSVEEIHRSDVTGQIPEVKLESVALREDVQRLRSELKENASAADVAGLSGDVAQLKRTEAAVAIPGEFPFCARHPLNGIVAHFGGRVSVTVSSVDYRLETRSSHGGCYEFKIPLYKPQTVAYGAQRSLEGPDCFKSDDKPNSWIGYDFRERRVSPTSYSIMSYPTGPGGINLKSWVLEVSSDGGTSWTAVDSRNDNFDLNDKLVTRNFAISAPLSGSFRFVRLRQTGKNHAGNDRLGLSRLEIFGKVSPY